MNNLKELKTKKPEDLKSRSSVLADYVTDDNTGGYFVVECGNCGEVLPSQKLGGGGAIADTGDYGDSYCPHCNAVDPDECDNVGLVWNIQQAKINALISQLEAAQKENGVVRNKYESMSTAYSSVTAELAKAEAELSAANERASREYPETLPCPVRLEPGLLLGKGLPIAMLFRALSRRADYEAEIYAMTPEQRAEHDQRTREGKKFISECIAPRPAGFTVEGE